MRTRHILSRHKVLGLATGLTVVLFSGCSSKQTEQPQPVVSVQVATVKRSTIRLVVTAGAVLYPLNQADIVPKISAPVSRFFVNRGDRVHSGELLAQLENKDLAAAVAQSEGAYQQAQAVYATDIQVNVPALAQAAKLSVRDTKQAMDAAQKVYASRQKLYQQGAIARKLVDDSRVLFVQAQSQYEIAQARLKSLESVGQKEQIKSAEAQLASAKGQYLAAQAQLAYSEICSPIDGIVTSRPLFPGEMASAGTPLMTVMNTSKMVARAAMTPEQAAWLRVGDAAMISGGGPGDVPGKVSVVSPALDPSSTTIQVWAEATNPGGELKAGSTVQLSVVAKSVPNALVIPASAVLTAADGTTSVMVVGKDNVAHQTQVKTGIHEGDNVEITSGLQAGERVVTEGAFGLPDGTKVQF
ncbi:MAG: efflux RND transporter periplasmic adaptor subunit [Terriglobia bacterium]